MSEIMFSAFKLHDVADHAEREPKAPPQTIWGQEEPRVIPDWEQAPVEPLPGINEPVHRYNRDGGSYLPNFKINERILRGC